MKTYNKSTLALTLLLSSLYVSADDHIDDDNAPDPGDHTKVSSVLSLTYGKQDIGNANNDVVEIIGQMSGAKSNGNLFLGQLTVKGQDNGKVGSDDFNLSQVRARYFEVTRIDSDITPMAGVSLDYIETSFTNALSDRLFAIGGLVKLETPFNNWLMFPILAGAFGQNNDDIAKTGYVDDNTWGVQFNLLNSIYLSKNGTHIQINPQFSSLDFGGELGTINQLQLDTAFQMPLSDNRQHWGKLTYTEYFDDVDQNFGHNRRGTEVKFTYSYYF